MLEAEIIEDVDPKNQLENTVRDIERRVALDIRRVGANIALERSLVARVAKFSAQEHAAHSATIEDDAAPPVTPVLPPVTPTAASPRATAPLAPLLLPKIAGGLRSAAAQANARRDSLDRKIEKVIVSQKLMNDQGEDDDPVGLQKAFESIAASFDMDGDGTLAPREVLHVLGRCQLLDDVLTATKVQNFFRTWEVGCNQVLGENMDVSSMLDGIGWEEFEALIKWCSDMKGMDIARCSARVIRLSRKLCDGKSSVTRRLRTVFEAFCKQDAERLGAYEFSNLCTSVRCFQRETFSIGDTYAIFYRNCKHEKGINFDEFWEILEEIGSRLDIGDKVYELFASGVTRLDVDEADIRRVKLKVKHAASSASTEGWRQFFHSCDIDGSGRMDWDEFYHMCKERLQLPERENHLKILFEKLDHDDSGELSIDELIAFIEKRD